jgi:hypothetical protein
MQVSTVEKVSNESKVTVCLCQQSSEYITFNMCEPEALVLFRYVLVSVNIVCAPITNLLASVEACPCWIFGLFKKWYTGVGA